MVMINKINPLRKGKHVKFSKQSGNSQLDVYEIDAHVTYNNQIFYVLKGLSGLFLRRSLVTTFSR